MLAADKDLLFADVHQRALELRQIELDALIQRYSSMIAVASICAGFAFSGLVEFELPEVHGEDDLMSEEDIKDMHGIFYCMGVAALVLGIYVTVISTLLIAAGYRLALQGGTKHSIDRAVAILRMSFLPVITAGGVSLLCLLLATLALVWIKLDHALVGAKWTSVVLVALGIIATASHGVVLVRKLSLRIEVDGDVVIQVAAPGGGMQSIELEDVEPAAVPSPQPATAQEPAPIEASSAGDARMSSSATRRPARETPTGGCSIS